MTTRTLICDDPGNLRTHLDLGRFEPRVRGYMGTEHGSPHPHNIASKLYRPSSSALSPV